MIPIKLHITSKWCNHWPYIKITFNDAVVFDSELEASTDISLDLDPILDSNTLEIVHYNKSFGDNGVYDTKLDSQGNIIEDCTFQVTDLSLNNIEFNTLAFKRISFISDSPCDDMYLNNIVGINGKFVISFPREVYSWMTLLKFKQDTVNTDEQYSNTSQLYHYEKDEELIEEIKKLLDFK
jgi:hypothetical protein